MKSSFGSLVAHLFLLSVFLLSFGYSVVGFGGKLFLLELAGFALLLVLALIAIILKSASGEGGMAFTLLYGLALVNYILLFIVGRDVLLIGLLAAMAGYLLVLWKPSAYDGRAHGSSKARVGVEAPYLSELAKDEQPAMSKVFTPGRFVASKNSKWYHAAKCEWAKKINKKRQAWFADEVEAAAKGYQKHNCN